jgi:mono/diheme cytochrome c family protein
LTRAEDAADRHFVERVKPLLESRYCFRMSLVRIVLPALVAASASLARAEDAADRHFVERVKPLLESRCVSCHGPDKVKGGLRLDSRAAVLKAGESGLPAVVPGKPAESLLLHAVMHSRKDLEMPPKGKLTTNDIAVLERWIRDGAPWPKAELIAAAAPRIQPGERLGDAWHDPHNPIVRLFGGQRLGLWSLQPVKRVEPPAVRNRRWPRNPIDRFILARLEAAALAPSVEADRRALARRLYFDLIGLPPTPEQMERFLADRRADAYERLVDELLESPRYGEHWARLWLDVVRYSDSNGFDWDEFRPRAWRYRDYVIGAFNADKPFNRFIREQLAGDELCDGPPRTPAEQDALTATGYLRLGPQDNSAGAFNEQDRARAELMADLTETTGSAFLGLTLSCCRCHDHKYDPLSQVDHYRIRAFFEAVSYADDTPLDLAPEQEAIRLHNKSLDERVKPLQQQRDECLVAVRNRLRDERIAKLPPEEKALLDTPKEQRADDAKVKIDAIQKKIEPSDKAVKSGLLGDEKQRYEKLEKEIVALNKQRRDFTLGLLMSDATNHAPVTRILFQGDHKAQRDPVEPGFISALDPNPAILRPALNRKTTGRRLTLADWIASPDNPLTARVLVNRVWQGHFGLGLVATPNDFGLAGAGPTHPELLDWLASEFVRQGWSLKKLHRLVVTSATYRQRSGIYDLRSTIYESRSDPGNALVNRKSNVVNSDLCSRPTLRRLSAEQLRDALLAVSGLLTNKDGGPPVWPDLPPEILQANPAFLDDNGANLKGWYPSPKSGQNVRSIYLVQKRSVRVPFMETFDLPENSVSCARRTVSTVAPQAFSLLNSPLAIEAAKALADRVSREAGENGTAAVNRAFALALQRPPKAEEREACLRLLRQRNLAEVCRALLNLNEFIHLD